MYLYSRTASCLLLLLASFLLNACGDESQYTSNAVGPQPEEPQPPANRQILHPNSWAVYLEGEGVIALDDQHSLYPNAKEGAGSIMHFMPDTLKWERPAVAGWGNSGIAQMWIKHGRSDRLNSLLEAYQQAHPNQRISHYNQLSVESMLLKIEETAPGVEAELFLPPTRLPIVKEIRDSRFRIEHQLQFNLTSAGVDFFVAALNGDRTFSEKLSFTACAVVSGIAPKTQEELDAESGPIVISAKEVTKEFCLSFER